MLLLQGSWAPHQLGNSPPRSRLLDPVGLVLPTRLSSAPACPWQLSLSPASEFPKPGVSVCRCLCLFSRKEAGSSFLPVTLTRSL